MEVMRRLSFDIPAEMSGRLNHWIPWGIKSLVMRALVERLLADIESRGSVVITELMEKK